jgi:hypothetical protein
MPKFAAEYMGTEDSEAGTPEILVFLHQSSKYVIVYIFKFVSIFFDT